MSHWSDKESYHKIFNDKIEHIRLDLERPNKLRLNFCDYKIGVSSNIEAETNSVFVVMEDERSGLIELESLTFDEILINIPLKDIAEIIHNQEFVVIRSKMDSYEVINKSLVDNREHFRNTSGRLIKKIDLDNQNRLRISSANWITVYQLSLDKAKIVNDEKSLNYKAITSWQIQMNDLTPKILGPTEDRFIRLLTGNNDVAVEFKCKDAAKVFIAD